ncbi:hypothetical protein DFQ26_000723, partial [Actinomortierella ambigua]
YIDGKLQPLYRLPPNNVTLPARYVPTPTRLPDNSTRLQENRRMPQCQTAPLREAVQHSQMKWFGTQGK